MALNKSQESRAASKEKKMQAVATFIDRRLEQRKLPGSGLKSTVVNEIGKTKRTRRRTVVEASKEQHKT